jgi:hypothetical protein
LSKVLHDLQFLQPAQASAAAAIETSEVFWQSVNALEDTPGAIEARLERGDLLVFTSAVHEVYMETCPAGTVLLPKDFVKPLVEGGAWLAAGLHVSTIYSLGRGV